MLTGKQIRREVERGRICIDPFDPTCLNPNSYNLKLYDGLLVYEKNYPVHEQQQRLHDLYKTQYFGDVSSWSSFGPWLRLTPPHLEPLDMKVKEATRALNIPEEGLTLWPGVLYLAATVETAGAEAFIPCIEGRSSVGRLGLCVHVTAGFGDLNFSPPKCPANWTLEVTVIHPLTVYAGVEVCQIAFTTPEQDEDLGELPKYEGKYTGQRGPKPSGLWEDFQK